MSLSIAAVRSNWIVFIHCNERYSTVGAKDGRSEGMKEHGNILNAAEKIRDDFS